MGKSSSSPFFNNGGFRTSEPISSNLEQTTGSAQLTEKFKAIQFEDENTDKQMY